MIRSSRATGFQYNPLKIQRGSCNGAVNIWDDLAFTVSCQLDNCVACSQEMKNQWASLHQTDLGEGQIEHPLQTNELHTLYACHSGKKFQEHHGQQSCGAPSSRLAPYPKSAAPTCKQSCPSLSVHAETNYLLLTFPPCRPWPLTTNDSTTSNFWSKIQNDIRAYFTLQLTRTYINHAQPQLINVSICTALIWVQIHLDLLYRIANLYFY